MADVRHLLRAQARQRGVRLDIVEKDYALSYLLEAISGISEFRAIVLRVGPRLKRHTTLITVSLKTSITPPFTLYRCLTCPMRWTLPLHT
ncbi:MAG: hypothetical protein ACOY16_03065 [Chloroflexota bacterium]